MKHIAIFASGTGSNARKIIEHFESDKNVKVSLIVSNKATAPVLNIAKDFGIDQLVIDRKQFYESQDILNHLSKFHVDLVVLAGFLWLIPAYLVQNYAGKIVNIHPALLPKYGGKGMYGMNVHQAVFDQQDSESGITIHFVNEHYDEGAVIFQAKCAINKQDSPTDIAKKVLTLEHKYFPVVIANILNE